MTNVELKYDCHGLTRALDAKIQLPGPLLDIQPGDIGIKGKDNSDPSFNVLETALEVINKFIDGYRYLSGEFHVKRLSRHDLVGVWMMEIDWYKDRRYVVSSAVSLLTPGLTLARNPAPVGFQAELQEWLYKPHIPLHGLLLLNAKANMQIGDYRMAIIDSRSSLEVMVDGILTEGFSSKSFQQVCEALKVKRAPAASGIRGAIDSATINDKLKHGLRSAVGWSLADAAGLWRRWLNGKRIREEAVHYGQAVTERQAEDHIALVDEIRDMLSVDGVSENWEVTYVQSGSFTTEWFRPQSN